MNTLDDAWRWYEAARASLKRLTRLALYWNDLPWAGPLGRDNVLRVVEQPTVATDTERAEVPLDDLAVLVLFSVFESQVRAAVLGQVRPEADALAHPVLRLAAARAVDVIDEGSFFRLLEPYKSAGHAALVEQVNQVRRYRNWVAHGRRGAPHDVVDPKAAYERMHQFLQQVIRLQPDPLTG